MKDYAVWKTHLGTKTTLIAQRRDKANHKRFRAQYAQTTKDSIQHTCQVSRIGRVTHAFRPNLTLTRIKLKISRIRQIIIKSHALSNKIGRVHQSALHVLCGIILVFSQGSSLTARTHGARAHEAGSSPGLGCAENASGKAGELCLVYTC